MGPLSVRASWALAQRPLLCVGVLIYLVLLYFMYAFHISPRFAYLGYVYTPAPSWAVALAILAAWLPALWMPLRLERPSQVVYWLLYVLAYAPSCVVPFLSLDRPVVDLLSLLAVLLLSFALLGVAHLLPLARIPRLRLTPRTYWAGVGILSGTLFAAILLTYGFSLDVPGLLDVYDVRSDFREAEANALVRYGVTWLGNVLFPLLIVMGFLRRSPGPLSLGIVGQLYIFSTTGFKTVAFSGLLIIAVLFALSRRGRYFGLAVAWGATGLVVASWALDAVFRTVVVSSMFVRRLILTPGILSGWYFDFFSDHPQVRLGHSVLEGLVPYPYDRLPPLLIGNAYFGREQTYANANVWADAYANFGFPGVIGFTLLLLIVFWAFDCLIAGRPYRQLVLVAAVLTGPAISLANTSLIASLVTHGLAFLWFVLYGFPKSSLMRTSQSSKPRAEADIRTVPRLQG